MPRRCLDRVSVGKAGVMIEVFIVYLSHYRKMAEIVPLLAYNRLLTNPSQFMDMIF